MAKAQHVNGPALISIGAGGTGGGLTELGLSEDGVDLEFELFFDDVIADSGGPHVPVDVQDFGKLAMISAKLVVYDSTVLEGLITLAAAAPAQEPEPGKLLLANGKLNRVVIASPDEANPWRFFYCHLVSPLALPKIGSRRTMPTCRFRALPGTGVANTMATLPLFDHVAA